MWLTLQFYQNGVITAEEACKCMEYCYSNRPSLGALAIRTRMLKIGQLFEVLRVQVDDYRRFGEIALEMGMLTQSQVEELWKLQNQETPSVYEALISTTELTTNELDAAFAKVRESSLSDAMSHHNSHDNVREPNCNSAQQEKAFA